jgi:hypothetical protein
MLPIGLLITTLFTRIRETRSLYSLQKANYTNKVEGETKFCKLVKSDF